MLQRGTGKVPPSRRLRAVAWLLAGVMLYAGGLGHLLHPWLHEHASPPHLHLGGRAAGPCLQAPAQDHAHGPCALCSFLAHFVAREAEPPLAWTPGPVPLGRPLDLGRAPLARAHVRLPGSRSPPGRASR